MRRTLLSTAAAAVAGLALLLLPGQGFARGHGGHGGHSGHGGGGHAFVGHHGSFSGHHVGFYGHRGFYGNRGFYGHRRFYGGYAYPFLYGSYSYPYYSYYSVPYYDTVPYYAGTAVDEAYSPSYAYPVTTAATSSSAENVASVTVYSPAPNAQIWFNDSPVTVQGSSQTFTTPPLVPGQEYHYQVRARWTENGQTVVREQSVPVHAGEQVVVDFQQAR
jgi:uncharacterized protein (TIGR03000 family)